MNTAITYNTSAASLYNAASPSPLSVSSALTVADPGNAAVGIVTAAQAASDALVSIRVSGGYVPSTNVPATDTAQIQMAHDALSASGGTLRLDAGPYNLSAGGIVVTKPLHLIGTGPGGPNVAAGDSYRTTGSAILCAAPNVVALTVNADGFTAEKLYVRNLAAGTPTAGSGILIGSVAPSGRAFRLVDCAVEGFYVNVEVVNGYEWCIDRCQLLDFAKYGIRIRDVSLADGGDGVVSGCSIIANRTANYTPVAGIQWESGGGLKVLGTKINANGALTVGIDFAVADGAVTSVGVVTGCSIENVVYGVLVGHAGPANTGQFSKLNVSDSEFLVSQFAVAVAPAVTGKIRDIVIGGGNVIGPSGQGLVLLTNSDNVTVVGNHVPTGFPTVTLQTSGGAGVTNLYMDGVASTTSARLPASTMRAGSRYFDSTLNKPIWADGAGNWRDASGAIV